MPEHSPGSEEQQFVAALRQRAATWQLMADHLSTAASETPPEETMSDPMLQRLGITEVLDTLHQRMQAIAQRARLSGEVEAAHALAYQEMLEAGGSANPEAYRKYQEATARHIALLPGDDLRHEPGAPTN